MYKVQIDDEIRTATAEEIAISKPSAKKLQLVKLK